MERRAQYIQVRRSIIKFMNLVSYLQKRSRNKSFIDELIDSINPQFDDMFQPEFSYRGMAIEY